MQSEDSGLDAAIKELAAHTDAGAREKAVATLRAYMNNIVQDEQNEKYRKIRSVQSIKCILSY